jgi:hypothetical protein
VAETVDARLSKDALGYLLFPGLHGYARFDYAWLLAAKPLYLPELAGRFGADLGIQQLKDVAARLGFSSASIDVTLRWAVTRMALRTGLVHAASFTTEHFEAFRAAVQAFLHRRDLPAFHPCAAEKFDQFRKSWMLRVNQFGLLLFHRGQISTQSRKIMKSIKVRASTPAEMQAVVDRWLVARRATDRPAGPKRFDIACGWQASGPRSQALRRCAETIYWLTSNSSPDSRALVPGGRWGCWRAEATSRQSPSSFATPQHGNGRAFLVGRCWAREIAPACRCACLPSSRQASSASQRSGAHADHSSRLFR